MDSLLKKALSSLMRSNRNWREYLNEHMDDISILSSSLFFFISNYPIVFTILIAKFQNDNFPFNNNFSFVYSFFGITTTLSFLIKNRINYTHINSIPSFMMFFESADKHKQRTIHYSKLEIRNFILKILGSFSLGIVINYISKFLT